MSRRPRSLIGAASLLANGLHDIPRTAPPTAEQREAELLAKLNATPDETPFDLTPAERERLAANIAKARMPHADYDARQRRNHSAGPNIRAAPSKVAK